MVNAPRRPATLGAGGRVRFDDVVRTVVGVSGTLIRLADSEGNVVVIPLPVLQAHKGVGRHKRNFGNQRPFPLVRRAGCVARGPTPASPRRRGG